MLLAQQTLMIRLLRPQRLRYMMGLFLLLSLLLSQGCAVVRVNSQDTAQSLLNQRDSILTRNRLSEATISLLSMIGQSQSQCLAQFERCLDTLKNTSEISTEHYLSAASELYLQHAEFFRAEKTHCQAKPIAAEPTDRIVIRLRSTPENQPQFDQQPVEQCQQQRQLALLNSIRHAYGYLFWSNRPAQQRLFDNRQVQVRDFYNVAVARLVDEQFSAQKDIPQQFNIQIAGHNIQINDHNQLFAQQRPEQLVAADLLGFRGLRTVNRRDGFGVEFVAVMPAPVSTTQQRTPTDVHQSRYLPLSLVVRVEGDSLENILSSQQFVADLYNPYQQTQIQINDDHTLSLAANFSAPYGLWLARTELALVAYRSLLGLDDQNIAPQLYMLEP
ncbi:MAG: hypothetical protein VXW65_02465, partial [Pseudomonadota bacterium]|nr:hypothetical protein [Pseudomonadota bacterium]